MGASKAAQANAKVDRREDRVKSSRIKVAEEEGKEKVIRKRMAAVATASSEDESVEAKAKERAKLDERLKEVHHNLKKNKAALAKEEDELRRSQKAQSKSEDKVEKAKRKVEKDKR